MTNPNCDHGPRGERDNQRPKALVNLGRMAAASEARSADRREGMKDQSPSGARLRSRLDA